VEKFNLIRGIAVGADPTASLIRIRPDVYEAEILEGEGWVSGAFVVRARPLNGFWALIVRIGCSASAERTIAFRERGVDDSDRRRVQVCDAGIVFDGMLRRYCGLHIPSTAAERDV
jgi:hypothetical protein